MPLPTLSVVVPVHDGEPNLRELVARLQAVLADCTRRFELILVNDGSRDASWATIQELCAKLSWIRGLDLARNCGQHNALLCGVRCAREEWIVTLDDDLQHPPEQIPLLLAAAAQGADVVYGSASNPDAPALRRIAAGLARRMLAREIGEHAARRSSAFRCFRTSLRESFAEEGGRSVPLDVLLAREAVRVAAIAVRLEPRRRGKSGYGLRRLVALAWSIRRGGRAEAPGAALPYVVRSRINLES